MTFPRLARFALCAFLLLLSTATYAQRNKKEVNEYPNATRSDPKSTMSEREQRDLSKATDLVNDGKGTEAMPLIDKALANAKIGKYAEAYAYQLQGRAKWELDDEAGAIEATKKAIDLNTLPNNQHFPLLYQLAQMYVQGENYTEALATLERWEKEAGKTTPDSLALKGNAFYRLDRFQEAIDTMKKAIAGSETPSESWSQILMASYFELNQFDEAAKLTEAELAKKPNDIRLIKQLATIYVQGDNYPKAIEVLSKARSQGLITSADDYMQLAKLYANADKPKDASEVLKEGLAKGIVPASLDSLRLQGDLCSQFDDDACAIDAYTKASPLAKDGNVDYQLGYLLFYADKAAQAKEAFTRALTKGGLRQEGETYVLRGDTENELGNDAAALADWRKATTYPSAKTMAEQRIKAATGGVKLKRPVKSKT